MTSCARVFDERGECFDVCDKCISQQSESVGRDLHMEVFGRCCHELQVICRTTFAHVMISAGGGSFSLLESLSKSLELKSLS